jgi:hypothetical protein
MIWKCEFCHESINITKCSNCAWLYDSSDCVNVYFSSDCRGCTDCFGCLGLRNKQYYFFNENIGKEEYEKRVKNIDWTHEFIKDLKEKFFKFKSKFPVKYYHGSQIYNSTGDYIENCDNSKMLFNCRDNKDTSYSQDAWRKVEDSRDCTETIICTRSYEIQGVDSPYQCIVIRSCFNTITDSCYCDMCFSAQDCFGCFGLKQKQYCILNKQYRKEEYFKLKERVIEHMRKSGEWGEYFPAKFSPFAYNESMAQDYFPLTKEEALKKGYTWYDRPERNYEITKGVIKCATQNSEEDKKNYPLCTTAFRITKLEETLYKKMKLPLPEKCFPCRRQDRFKMRNPRRLWSRKCMKEGRSDSESPQTRMSCENEFETSYAPDRPEKVYCERCYQQEVY